MFRDTRLCIFWLEKAARQGLPKAQYEFGNCYDHGFGVDKDHEKALYWWQRAANQGYAKAQEKLGR